MTSMCYIQASDMMIIGTHARPFRSFTEPKSIALNSEYKFSTEKVPRNAECSQFQIRVAAVGLVT